jgi:Glycosyltransferase family 87
LFILYLMIPEIVTSHGNFQTNPLIASFCIFTVVYLEKESFQKAAIFPSLNFFIKGYGGIAGVFFLLQNPKLKHFIYLIITGLAFWMLPLFYYNFHDFIQLNQQWITSLSEDYDRNMGISVMGMLQTMAYSGISKTMIQGIGALIFAILLFTIIYRKNYNEYRYPFLAYVLIWVIIFNHAAESSTYFIASTGVFIWFVNAGKNWLNIALFVLFYVVTVMSPSDLFPALIRKNYIAPYSLKTLPCLLIWLKINIQIIFPNFRLSNIVLWKRKSI